MLNVLSRVLLISEFFDLVVLHDVRSCHVYADALPHPVPSSTAGSVGDMHPSHQNASTTGQHTVSLHMPTLADIKIDQGLEDQVMTYMSV